MAGKDLLFTLVLFTSLVMGGGCWILERRLESLRRAHSLRGRQLQEALAKLKACESSKAPPAPPSVFAADLEQADLKHRLKGGGDPGTIPEKYRLVAAMARRGLEAADISEILEMSVGETEQLLKLARVGEDSA